MKYKRVIAVYSDMHVGSKYAIMPQGFQNREGNLIGLNDGQKYLLQHWNRCKKICDKHNVDTVILAGDLIHGLHYKRQGEGLMLSELEEQKAACLELLEPICRNRTVIGISGTDYHNSRDTKTEKQIIEMLKGTYCGYVMNGDIKYTKRTINVMHGSSGALIYRETAAGREMLFFKEAEALGKTIKADILLRAHNHFYLHMHRRSVHYIINPCWQILEPSQYTTRNYAKFQPDLGMSLLLIDSDDRISSWHFLTEETPHITDFVRNI